MAGHADSLLQGAWYGKSPLYLALVPLAVLFAVISGLRRFLFRTGLRQSRRVGVPVVVVGNIAVGGTGKTPVTLWLADALRRRGFRPGIVSRGYGGVVGGEPLQANAGGDPAIVGDEPLLLAERSRCPVIVHPDRVAAAQALVDGGVDIVISDDGLQHYRLARDVEIVVVDAARGFGNGWRLPAGPLREPVSRLGSVDRVLVHARSRNDEAAVLPSVPTDRTSTFHLVAQELVSLDGNRRRSFEELAGQPVHAVAAIGNPERFFRELESRGLAVTRHPFADHARLEPADVRFDDGADIVMTEKDAVKCRSFASDRMWYVPVDVDMHDERWLEGLVTRLRNRQAGEGQ